MADPQPRILDFTTHEARQPVRINGVTYQMRLPSDLSFADRQRLAVLASQLAGPLVAIERGVTLPKGQQKLVKKLLLDVCSQAISAPPSILVKLDQLDQIVLAVSFLERSLARLNKVHAMLRPATVPPNGASSSPVSAGSTAAGRRSGRTSRSASSKRT
jgi:hypothetical protein